MEIPYKVEMRKILFKILGDGGLLLFFFKEKYHSHTNPPKRNICTSLSRFGMPNKPLLGILPGGIIIKRKMIIVQPIAVHLD
jgi:hypothetical protein